MKLSVYEKFKDWSKLHPGKTVSDWIREGQYAAPQTAPPCPVHPDHSMIWFNGGWICPEAVAGKQNVQSGVGG